MIRSAIFLALLAIIAAPLSAQRVIDEDRIDRSQIGSRFQLELEPMENGKLREMVKRLGRCLARSDRELSAQILENSDPSTIDYSALRKDFNGLLDELNMRDCFRTTIPRSARYMRIQYNPMSIRTMLAEEMYLHKRDEPISIPEGAPIRLENRFFVGGMADPRTLFLADFADCVVYNAPETSHAMLDADPNSRKEREAAEALVDTFGTCLGTEDDATFTIAQMRNFLADGLWSRSHYGADSYELVQSAAPEEGQ